MRRAAWAAGLAAICSCWASVVPAVAAEKAAADLFPATSILYVEAPHPAQCADLIAKHPLVKRLAAVEPVQKALSKDGKFQEFLTKLREFEEVMGRTWRESLEDVAGQGAYFAIEPASQGGALLLRGRDAESVRKFSERLREIVLQEMKARGHDVELRDSTYRGQTVLQHQDTFHATFGEWFLLTNKETLGRTIIDNFLDEDDVALADEPLFQEARATAPGERAAWLYGRLDILRLVGAGKKVFADRLEEPAAELVGGGVVAALQKANYVSLSLQVADDEIKLIASAPFNPAKVADARSFYFSATTDQAPAPLNLPSRLMSLTAYRDVAKWWAVSEEVFPEAIAAKLAQADSQLTLFFSGKDFSTEILGKLEPQYQFVLSRQDYSKLGAKSPNVKLPAGAMIFKTKPGADLGRTMRIAFQSIVGLANINAGQEGRPQFELMSRNEEGVEFTAATYSPALEADDKDAQGIHRNFSPTLAVSGPWIIFSSTETLAKDAVAALKTDAGASSDNVRLDVDYAPLAQILEDNREHLVHQNMLEKGHDREAAEAEIGLLFQVVSMLRGASARLTPADRKLTLELDVKLSGE